MDGRRTLRVFAFDPAQYRDRYREQGWVHIRGGIDPAFHEHLREVVRRPAGNRLEKGLVVGGQKEQSIFEFPGEVDFPGELFDVVASLCGLNRPTMTLSERHIKAYEPDADPEPPAHKDRFPSQVSVGLSIDIPAESRLVIYPFDHREVNPFIAAAAFRRSLRAEELPEVVLKTAREVEIDDAPGDVVMFPGADLWHLRRNSAGATNLYLKFNDFDCDPLGEDPATPTRRSDTLRALKGRDGDLSRMVPRISRRLASVNRQYTRNHWKAALQAEVWGEEPFPIGEAEFRLLQAVDGRRDVRQVADELAGEGLDRSRAAQDVRRLAEEGALDLVPGAWG